MRTEFNNLVETLKTWDLYQVGDEVDIAISELESKITEIEKRLECARRSNLESNSIVVKMTETFEGKGAIEDKITYGEFETLARGVYDVDIALNFNDNEPIENNWYDLFKPKKEEPKVLIPKDSIVEWKETRQYYNVQSGAKAKVTQDYTTEQESDDNYLMVEWLDDYNQENGGYERDCFKEEFERPKRILDTTMGKNVIEDIIQKLKDIEVDGETMQYILKEVGMEDQMLRQLVMSNQTSETTDLLEEKRILSNQGKLV